MTSKYQMVNKAVSFNVLDPDQKDLFEHAMKRKNFSSYIKRLIQRDMEGVMPTTPVMRQVDFVQPVEVEESFDDDLMTNLI